MTSAGHYVVASLAPSSRVLYAKSVMRLQRVALSLAAPQTWFPASALLICIFIAHLLDAGLAPATVYSTLSAVSFFHKLFSFPDPTTDFIVKRMMIGGLKLNPSVDDRLPISLSMLHMLCDSCVHVTVSSFSADMLRSMYLLMFHGFLRVGEVTKSHNNIALSQMSLAVQSVTITFHHAKHLVGPPISVSIPASGGSYCPVSNVLRYLAARGTTPGPLFCSVDLEPVTTSMFNGWLDRSLRHCSLASLSIKSHSFRIGAATHSASLGFTDIQIQKMGRWKSNAFRKYIRISSFKTI